MYVQLKLPLDPQIAHNSKRKEKYDKENIEVERDMS